jgi:hypothetical protein
MLKKLSSLRCVEGNHRLKMTILSCPQHAVRPEVIKVLLSHSIYVFIHECRSEYTSNGLMPDIRQSKLFSTYQQLNALMIHSLTFFVAKKSVPNFDKMMLSLNVLFVIEGPGKCEV